MVLAFASENSHLLTLLLKGTLESPVTWIWSQIKHITDSSAPTTIDSQG